MTYNEALDLLFKSLPAYHLIGKSAYKANLDNTTALDNYLGNPHKSFKTIHIAGTNGKGSVSHMLASALMEAGYKTALFTSPHLKDFRERIKVDGKMVPKEYVVAFVGGNIDIINKIKPSFFELSVAMAFDWFRACEVDVAVVETGLGGRLDSTNIITPLLSVITNIGLEHTHILGDSYEKIAAEKGGIIKDGVPVVIGETHPLTKPVFMAKAGECGSDLFFADSRLRCEWVESGETGAGHEGSWPLRGCGWADSGNGGKSESGRLYRVMELEGFSGQNRGGGEEPKVLFSGRVPLGGDYQQKNIQTVAQAYFVLRGMMDLGTDNLVNGISKVVENTGLIGRWQILGREPLTICDAGHNSHGLEYTVRQLASIQKRTLRCVLGFSDDKDIDAILPLFPKDARYYFTKAAVDRAMAADLLAQKAAGFGLLGSPFGTVKEACAAAKSESSPEDVIFIGGSMFVIAEIL